MLTVTEMSTDIDLAPAETGPRGHSAIRGDRAVVRHRVTTPFQLCDTYGIVEREQRATWRLVVDGLTAAQLSSWQDFPRPISVTTTSLRVEQWLARLADTYR